MNASVRSLHRSQSVARTGSQIEGLARQARMPARVFWPVWKTTTSFVMGRVRRGKNRRAPAPSRTHSQAERAPDQRAGPHSLADAAWRRRELPGHRCPARAHLQHEPVADHLGGRARVQRYMIFQLCGYSGPCPWLAVAMSKPHMRVESARCAQSDFAAAAFGSQQAEFESRAQVTSKGDMAR